MDFFTVHGLLPDTDTICSELTSYLLAGIIDQQFREFLDESCFNGRGAISLFRKHVTHQSNSFRQS
jgi:hypothetical protein